MSTTFFSRLLLLGLLAGCGSKPDGTPYGVNPAKHTDGHLHDTTNYARPDHETRGMPKAAEANAISNGGTQGQVETMSR